MDKIVKIPNFKVSERAFQGLSVQKPLNVTMENLRELFWPLHGGGRVYQISQGFYNLGNSLVHLGPD